MPSEVGFRQLPGRIARRQDGLGRSPTACKRGLWDEMDEEERQTGARTEEGRRRPRRRKIERLKYGEKNAAESLEVADKNRRFSDRIIKRRSLGEI